MNNLKKIEYSLKKRKRQESRFKIYGLLGIATAVSFLCIILSSIFMEGKKAFLSTYIKLEVYFDPAIIYTDNDQKEEDIKFANFQKIIKNSLNSFFPEISDKGELRKLSDFISSSEEENLMRLVLENKQLIGQKVTLWLLASSKIDVINKNPDMELIAEEDRLISNLELNWLNEIRSANNIKSNFNKNFFVKADSTEPEQAGIWGSLVGSFFTLFVTLILSFPIAVAAGVFLEELAPKNKFTDFIEVNINNLAAVPSIIFGLLGLAIFLNVMHLPRSAPIVGGMVLALMTLPTIIIATRASLKAVPPSIREAAIGLGATKFQTVTHHVLPLSLPGILTGTIIGMSQALGESAPLLMIGMVAFIVDVPGSFLDSSTVLPVQIYLWKSTAARGFVELTAAGVMVLLSFLILMNGIAVYIRQKFEKKW
ncbi:MAG: phosphate ABC transporter, permease protein PstA [Pelagibacteraceae bacterium TMED65]|nr:phosphate ABC transporter, permease protein PstA [Rickettsiales bacterium]OUU51517.1 MAG: phosphate ABC transporter, permease protein PstA [Pelagibacteraceae bacterium TMED65]